MYFWNSIQKNVFFDNSSSRARMGVRNLKDLTYSGTRNLQMKLSGSSSYASTDCWSIFPTYFKNLPARAIMGRRWTLNVFNIGWQMSNISYLIFFFFNTFKYHRIFFSSFHGVLDKIKGFCPKIRKTSGKSVNKPL